VAYMVNKGHLDEIDLTALTWWMYNFENVFGISHFWLSNFNIKPNEPQSRSDVPSGTLF